MFWNNQSPPPIVAKQEITAMTRNNPYSVTLEGAALSILCGAALGLGYNLLRFDDHDDTSGIAKKDNDSSTATTNNNTLAKSTLRATLGGALFNLGLYLIVPSWVREFWMYKGE